MRDPKRISKILKMIEKLWKKNPDLRFLQLIENLKRFNRLPLDGFYVEDTFFIDILKKELKYRDD